jgi:hypothetical protein
LFVSVLGLRRGFTGQRSVGGVEETAEKKKNRDIIARKGT